MHNKQILQLGDPLLRAKNSSVNFFGTEKFLSIVDVLKKTMHQNSLVGIAAPQLGFNYKIFITEIYKKKDRPSNQIDPLRIYINPKIVWESSEKVSIYEGCGSVLNSELYGPVLRPKIIKIEATDLKGQKFCLKCDGILARYIQHEYDHLQGIIFLDRIKNNKLLISKEYYQKFIRVLSEQEKLKEITIKEYSV